MDAFLSEGRKDGYSVIREFALRLWLAMMITPPSRSMLEIKQTFVLKCCFLSIVQRGMDELLFIITVKRLQNCDISKLEVQK